MRLANRLPALAAVLLTAGLGVAQETSFLKAGDEWVCMGDSITFQNAYETYAQDTLDILYPGANIRVVNQGLNAAKAPERVGALSTYLDANKSTLVTVMFGVNDTRWSADDIAGKTQGFVAGMKAYADLCARRALPVVFLRETHWSHTSDVGTWEAGLNGALDALQAGEAALAKEVGVPFVDVRGAYEKALSVAWSVDPHYEFTPDIIHPNAAGHVPVAVEILRAFGAGLPLAAGDKRGPVRVEHESLVELTILPAHGLLPVKGELVVTVRANNSSENPVSGTLQAVIGSRRCTSKIDIPAKGGTDVSLKVDEAALPGRWRMAPIYVVFANEQLFTAAGVPCFHSRNFLSEKTPLALKPEDARLNVNAVGTVTNLVVCRAPESIRVEFDWLDQTMVAATTGFKNRFGEVIAFPLDLKLRGEQASDAVELLFDVRPPESIGRSTANTDGNPAGVVRVGLYREQVGDQWGVKLMSLPEMKPEQLKLVTKGNRMVVEFVPETSDPVGFSMRVTDRATWTQAEDKPACLTLSPTTGFEYAAFVQLALENEKVLYRIGY